LHAFIVAENIRMICVVKVRKSGWRLRRRGRRPGWWSKVCLRKWSTRCEW